MFYVQDFVSWIVYPGKEIIDKEMAVREVR